MYLDGTYIHYMSTDKDNKKIYVYEDNNSIYMIMYINDLVSEEMDSIYNRYACLKLDGNNLKQDMCKSELFDSVYSELEDYKLLFDKKLD